METQAKKYTVVVTADFASNTGDPIKTTLYTYDELPAAESKYKVELKVKDDEYGVTTRVGLYESNTPEIGDEYDFMYTEISEQYRESKPLNQNAIVVFYRHLTYMNYAYEVLSVKHASETGAKTLSDLPYSYDSTSATWVSVLDTTDELVDAYEHAYYAPFDKLNRGHRVVEDFLQENKHPNYIDAE